jgi:Flp pilus assembly protein TadB
VALAADSERERAVIALRRHFEAGRLEVEEFAERAERALRARTTADLRAALRDLPRLGNALERGRAAAGAAAYVAVLAVVWIVGSTVLLGALGISFLFGSAGIAAVFLSLAWLVFSALLWLAGRRRLRLPRRRG